VRRAVPFDTWEVHVETELKSTLANVHYDDDVPVANKSNAVVKLLRALECVFAIGPDALESNMWPLGAWRLAERQPSAPPVKQTSYCGVHALRLEIVLL
jgi:hypothetical protein